MVSFNERMVTDAAAGFVVFGLAATRSAASELTRVSLSRAGAAAATPLRVDVCWWAT